MLNQGDTNSPFCDKNSVFYGQSFFDLAKSDVWSFIDPDFNDVQSSLVDFEVPSTSF